MQEFRDDEAGFYDWYTANAGGLVLNAPKSGAGTSMLHRVPCFHLDPAPGWNYTIGTKAKFCSTNEAELIERARQIGHMGRCLTCSP